MASPEDKIEQQIMLDMSYHPHFGHNLKDPTSQKNLQDLSVVVDNLEQLAALAAQQNNQK